MIFNVSGGGGTALNFRVVGNPQPANPTENCIWVDTDTPINSWIFSATQPSPAEPGMVWISTGTSSTVEFNALKKNGIQVYPISAKQYVSGAWVDKTAKIYQSGKWVEWNFYLCKDGKLREGLDGKWKTYGTGQYQTELTATQEADKITITTQKTNNSSGVIYWDEKYDLTGFSNLVFDGVICAEYDWGQILIFKEIGGDPVAAFLCSGPTNGHIGIALDGKVKIDISNLSGEYYIAFGLTGRENSAYISIRDLYFV